MKARTEKVIGYIPFIGEKINKGIFNLKTRIKNLIYKSTFFEELGFRYMGPIDGHNIEQLCEALNTAKLVNAPVLLHINTVKGKGYNFAEKSPSTYHGISKFNVETGEPLSSGNNFSAEFGKWIAERSDKDEKVCAVTAAMALGTGLGEYSNKFPDRIFDVGIAEEHAVTFASGLAKGGLKPVVAVYSTFLQRAYDQLVHDGTLQKQRLLIALDRSGFVGEDGVTHQGLLDVGYLNSIPDITVYSPFTFERMRYDLDTAMDFGGNLTVVRYPRGSEKPLPEGFAVSQKDFDFFEGGNELLIVSYGRTASNCAYAVEKLRTDKKAVSLLILNKIKPISPCALESALSFKAVAFFEEAERSGSIGQSFADLLLSKGYKGNYIHRAVEDEFVPHAGVESLMKKYGLDIDGIYNKALEILNG